VRWYRAAAEQGNADGQWKLAGMYVNGWGVIKNIDEAMRWVHAAADQGHPQAQDMLKKLA
jgi:TPR repeat protein